MPIPMPVEERYRPDRIASRSRMQGPGSLTRTIRSWGARRPSTAISTLPPPAYMKALRAISDTAVAMRVWSWPSKPRRAAISRARWRTATTSCSCRTKSETRGRLMSGSSGRTPDHRHLLGGRPLRRGLEAGDREAGGVRGPGPVAEAVDDHHGRTRGIGSHREAVPADVLARLRHAHPPGLHRESARLAPAVRVDP